MKKINILSLSLVLIVSSCTIDNKDDYRLHEFEITNLLNKKVRISSYNYGADTTFINTINLDEFDKQIDSAIAGKASEDLFFPIYFLSDSLIVVFDEEKYIYYLFEREFGTYNDVNNKNLINKSTWNFEDRSTNKKQNFKFSFEITEEDYALAEDL
jgi:hypothetical protein